MIPALCLGLWVTDLLNSNYEDVHTVRKSSDPLYPCIEQDALSGVYFSPSVLTSRNQEPNEVNFPYLLLTVAALLSTCVKAS